MDEAEEVILYNQASNGNGPDNSKNMTSSKYLVADHYQLKSKLANK